MPSKKFTIEAINTDAEDPNICTLTGKPIVNPPEKLEELKRQIDKTASLSPAAQIRKLLRETDPNLH